MTEKPIRIDSERRIVMQSPVTREGVPPNSATHDAREGDSRYGDDDMGRLRGQTVVVKYGGAAMTAPHLRDLFARDIASMRATGNRPVIVHGGRSQISRLTEHSGKTPHFAAGMRVTDEETMVIVETALRQVNEELVRLLEHQRVPATGFGGWERALI